MMFTVRVLMRGALNVTQYWISFRFVDREIADTFAAAASLSCDVIEVEFAQ
jgi:hypothetical protein